MLLSCKLYHFHLRIKFVFLQKISYVQGNSGKQFGIFNLVTSLGWVELSNVSAGMIFCQL